MKKTGLKLNIQKTKIMASSHITSWQIDGETVETGQTLFFWAPKSLQMVTAAMKLKDACLFLRRKVMTNLDSIFGEGNGNPLQCSCLENPRDREAWWATVYGVAQSQTRLSDFTFMHWTRKWQPTPVFLPGESQGQGSLMGCHLWGRTESDTTDAT